MSGYRDTYKDPYALGYKNGYYPNVSGTVVNSVATLLAASDPAQELINIMGHGTKPTKMWDFSVASGATDIIGSDNLSDTGTPTKQQDVSAAFGAGALATRFDEDSTDGCVAGSSGIGDVGDESVAWLVLFKIHTSMAASRIVIDKRVGLADEGYRFMVIATNALRWVMEKDDNLQSRVLDIAVDHGTTNPQTVLCLNDKTADVCGVYSREGSTTSTALPGSVSNTDILEFGTADLSAAGVDILLAAQWIGTGAEGITSAMRLAVAQQLGLE